MNENPKAALAAIAEPGPLTIGKVALLCRLEAPILGGVIDDLNDTLTALYVIERPLAESVKVFKDVRDAAILHYDGLSPIEYRRKVAAALDSVAAFWEMMPRPSPGAKKNSVTDGSPSSRNGSAGPTPTESSTSSESSRQSRRRSSGAAGSRGPAGAKRGRS